VNTLEYKGNKSDVETGANGVAEKPTRVQTVAVDVRLCKDCRHMLFSKADFDRAMSQKPPDQRSYEILTEFERGIRLLLPRFQKLLQALQDPDKSPTKVQLDQATKTRKRLTDSFMQYQLAATRIRDLPTMSPTQQRLQKAVHAQAMSFLHLHMLPLKSLPNILKHATPNGRTNGKGALANIHFNSHLDADTASQSSRSSAIECLEAEEKELKEKMILLEEQKFIVGEALADARKKRRFDDVKTLQLNVEELGREVDLVQKQLAGLDFSGVYAAGL
jgi:rabenosyn-5